MKIWAVLLLVCTLLSCHSPRHGTSSRHNYDLCQYLSCFQNAVVRGDSTSKNISLVFTGDEYADGGIHIRAVLKEMQVPAAFFFTGNFYRNQSFQPLITGLIEDGHYLGAHSDRHLLYCSWEDRDSLLIERETFMEDLAANYREMEHFGIEKSQAPYFLPPYEWYNEHISQWTRDFGLQLVSYSGGTLSHADYTTPGMSNYKSSETIMKSILDFESASPNGLNGFILLSHIGTAPERTDKFYMQLKPLIELLEDKGYRFVSLRQLLHKNS